jgi:tetratricopeptide (TPR) repeat protein
VKSPRVWAWILAAATLAYAGIAFWRGWFLLGSQDPTLIAFGIAIIALPILGVWVLWRELRFGFGMQRMGRALREQGELPPDDVPRTPSGRVELAAADERFQLAHEAVEADPSRWQAWYLLGLAYDDARDRRRARAAMRRALDLFEN